MELTLCIKAVMNHSSGLNLVLTKDDSIKNIYFNIDSNNVAMKTQLFELLAALSMFSKEGHK